jgi:hypothetical protein
MPVWHELTKTMVKDGQLAVLGVTQEQHAERCRLFAQWKQIDWPILHDPINVLESSAVPVMVAIDEYGIVRSTRPRPETFEGEFVRKAFAEHPSAEASPAWYGPGNFGSLDALRSTAQASNTADNWRAYGDALILWGGANRLNDAISAYTFATQVDPQDRRSFFRRGVALRRRYELSHRQPDDFQKAIENWGFALQLDPNQYIWRRRIQQYGPRLDKPYPFYDWVPTAEQAIRERGETPVKLPVRPAGAEIATPAKSFQSPPNLAEPDPNDKVARIEPGAVVAEVTVVPQATVPGGTVRVHVVFRVDSKLGKVHWNNEAEPLLCWLDVPADWEVSDRLLSTPLGDTAVSEEDRRIEFEVKVPTDASTKERIAGYALFHICDDAGGTCRFARLDVTVPITVRTVEP